ncbi:MAG: glucose-1-phosphate thymidylyltransferase, partial [Saprospiraceae bacterium]
MRDTGLQYLGTVMGDHSKAGIQTMFNTGTIVGVATNIFGEGYPPKVVPSFSWGGASGLTTHRLEDALDTARKVISRRDLNLSKEEEDILRHVFEITKSTRPLE